MTYTKIDDMDAPVLKVFLAPYLFSLTSKCYQLLASIRDFCH
jgi:hypothetical protein